ncbi:hypothetical protein CPB86DRAFT_778308 [Serendipita vermifera]|nr:hypothetical protein CPB86DRAFT_778308 [Serendipita vermifera]
MDVPTGAVNTNVGTNSSQILGLWLSFHLIAGHVLLPILVFTFVFLTKRPPTLVNLCLSWIFTGICSCILLYSKKQSGPEPSFDLCLVQASLLYGTLPLTATSCLALVYQIWNTVYPSTQKDNAASRLWQTFRPIIVLLGGPWIIWLIWATAAAWTGYHNPSRLSRNRRFFYCSLDFSRFSDGISAFCGIVLLVTIALEVSIVINIVRNWRAVRTDITAGNVDISLLIRVVFFGIYTFIGVVLGFLSIRAPKSPVPDLWLASVGLIVALIFGTQKNVAVALYSFITRRKNWREKRVDLLV